MYILVVRFLVCISVINKLVCRTKDAFIVGVLLFLIFLFLLFVDYRQAKADEVTIGKMPDIVPGKDNGGAWILSLTGLSEHHKELFGILLRFRTLSYRLRLAKLDYRKLLAQLRRDLNNIFLGKIDGKRPTHDWLLYAKYLMDLLKEKADEHFSLYEKWIEKKAKSLVENTVFSTGANYDPTSALKNMTEEFDENNPFLNELNELKDRALDQFYDEQLSLKHERLEKKMSDKSMKILQNYINKTKEEVKMMDRVKNLDDVEKRFKVIPNLLRRMHLYYRCFLLELPLFENSQVLLDMIAQNTVVTISTTTGSGM
jgi:hypothetical protein